MTAINFTKATLSALPTPRAGQRAYHHDTKTRGLTLSVTDKGTRSYVFYRKINGRPQRVLLGRFEELSVEQARNKAAELNAKVATGWDPRMQKELERQHPTLNELFKDFIERHAKANIQHSATYEKQFKRYFCTTEHGGLNLSSWKANEVTRFEIAKIFGNITGNGRPIAANRVLAMISSMFGWSTRAGLLESNPAKGIRKNSERGRARDRFLRSNEMPFFFKALSAHDSDVVRDYVLLSLLTGQRQGNVLAMEWSEIDFVEKIWRIPKSKTKTAREYLVPLTPEAIAVLERRLEAAHDPRYVLPGNGESGHFSEPKNGWKRLLLRAELYGLAHAVGKIEGKSAHQVDAECIVLEFGLDEHLNKLRAKAVELKVDVRAFQFGDLWMHDLRRTLASWQASTGANLVAISKTLNHSNVSTTSIYARLQTDPVRQAIQTATSAMFSAGGLTANVEIVGLRGNQAVEGGLVRAA